MSVPMTQLEEVFYDLTSITKLSEVERRTKAKIYAATAYDFLLSSEAVKRASSAVKLSISSDALRRIISAAMGIPHGQN